jgi:hypothetical protein
MSIVDGRIIIDIPLTVISLSILLAFTAWGWSRGYRYMVTIALAVTLGYLVTVQANSIVQIVNALYAFMIRLLSILVPPVANIFPPPPIIPDNQEAPWLLRVLAFYVLFFVGIGWKGPWETQVLRGFAVDPKTRQLRLLGALTGFYVGILFTSAAATFWEQSSVDVQDSVPGWLAVTLASLPTYSSVITVFIAAFGLLLAITLFLQFVRSLQR